jgi:hypothetical protein
MMLATTTCHTHHRKRSNNSSMKGSLKIQASGGRSLLRPMSAMSTPLIEMDMAVQSFSVCFVFHFFSQFGKNGKRSVVARMDAAES